MWSCMAWRSMQDDHSGVHLRKDRGATVISRREEGIKGRIQKVSSIQSQHNVKKLAHTARGCKAAGKAASWCSPRRISRP